ncbi:hypothetical protein D3C86_1831170 [compost metagenome]
MGHDQLPRLQRLLIAQRNELVQLHGLFIHDENGERVASSSMVTPSTTNNSDRDYFIFHREHPERSPHIGPSIKSRTTGEWVIPVSRSSIIPMAVLPAWWWRPSISIIFFGCTTASILAATASSI